MADTYTPVLPPRMLPAWESIETAPKDGEIIILALINETTVMIREGRWDEKAAKWTWPWICDLAPNLWMPLPPVPDLPTSPVDNLVENPMTDLRQRGLARVEKTLSEE